MAECPAVWFAVGPLAVWSGSGSGGGTVSSMVGLVVGLAVVLYLLYSLCVAWHVFYQIRIFLEFFVFVPSIPDIHVPLTAAETQDDGITTTGKVVAASAAQVSNIGSKPGFIQCYDPSTNQWLGEVPCMTAQDVHDCCVKAAKAQEEWRNTTFTQRRTVLRTIQKYCLQHIDEICRVASRDSGKPVLDAFLGEVITTCEKIRTVAAWGELWLQPDTHMRTTGLMMAHKQIQVEYVPVGILAPIAPWNYPFHNGMNHIISGIFAGNAVVAKCSEWTAWSAAGYFSAIVKEALRCHGHNPDLVQTVTGMAETGAALCREPLVDKIIFTGSPAIGQIVMATAAEQLKPVILELGGKDAMIITNDCTVQQVVPWVLRGCFQNCGQNCIGIERVLVYESILPAFLEAVIPKVKALRQGNPLASSSNCTGEVDCGALVMPQHIQLLNSLVQDAVKKGATLVCGGKARPDAVGTFYEPTLLTGVTPNMRIYREEVFGPIMTVITVPGDSDDACVALANDCPFGLGLSVFSGTNQARALAIGRRIHTGMLTVNDFASNYLIQSLPFGGVKRSGFGRFAGVEGLRACCHERTVVVDRFPKWIQTSIPPVMDYPIDRVRGMAFAHALAHFFYSESWMDKAYGLFNLIRYGATSSSTAAAATTTTSSSSSGSFNKKD